MVVLIKYWQIQCLMIVMMLMRQRQTCSVHLPRFQLVMNPRVLFPSWSTTESAQRSWESVRSLYFLSRTHSLLVIYHTYLSAVRWWDKLCKNSWLKIWNTILFIHVQTKSDELCCIYMHDGLVWYNGHTFIFIHTNILCKVYCVNVDAKYRLFCMFVERKARPYGIKLFFLYLHHK